MLSDLKWHKPLIHFFQKCFACSFLARKDARDNVGKIDIDLKFFFCI